MDQSLSSKTATQRLSWTRMYNTLLDTSSVSGLSIRVATALYVGLLYAYRSTDPTTIVDDGGFVDEDDDINNRTNANHSKEINAMTWLDVDTYINQVKHSIKRNRPTDKCQIGIITGARWLMKPFLNDYQRFNRQSFEDQFIDLCNRWINDDEYSNVCVRGWNGRQNIPFHQSGNMVGDKTMLETKYSCDILISSSGVDIRSNADVIINVSRNIARISVVDVHKPTRNVGITVVGNIF